MRTSLWRTHSMIKTRELGRSLIFQVKENFEFFNTTGHNSLPTVDEIMKITTNEKNSHLTQDIKSLIIFVSYLYILSDPIF